MKKLITLLLALVLVLSLSVSAFAAPSKEQVSGSAVVYITEGVEDGECEVIITPYADRATLPSTVKNGAEAKTEIEKAYSSIVNNDSAYQNLLSEVSTATGVAKDKLTVAYLFDASLSITSIHDVLDHFGYALEIESDAAPYQLSLAHYVDGAWVVVDTVTVTGKNIDFTVDSLSPFAILVSKDNNIGMNYGQSNTSPKTAATVLPLAAAAVAVAAGYVILKKKEN